MIEAPEEFTEDHISNLEGIFASLLDDSIEICWISKTGKIVEHQEQYDAYIVYEGTNCKENHGHIYFTARPVSKGKIEDWYVDSVTGSNMVQKDFSFCREDGGLGYVKNNDDY